MFRRKGVKLSKLEKKGDTYWYRGRWWKPNTPVKSEAKNKKMSVLATKTIDGERRGKIVHFGDSRYKHNYSAQAKRNYLKRSGGIRGKSGKLTKNDVWSANYWARKVLWPKSQKANGRALKKVA